MAMLVAEVGLGRQRWVEWVGALLLLPTSLANRFTHCDSIRDLDRNRITIGRIDSNRFEVVIHSDFVVNQNLYHHALTLGA